MTHAADPLGTLRAALAGRYRIERELGAGGMATVYLAHDAKHERDVAIKVLHPDLGAVLGPERFLGEIRTTAKLQHPHILPLLDSGEANGLLYYVMPYVRGETLRARLERETQLPIPDALRIATEVADALHHAHGQGIVHRDIKPENILLQDGHALVADFGIALAVSNAGGARMTQTGLSLGTPSYMSPEQAAGDRTVEARSDVYALGAVTYEMLTGAPPFTGPSVQAIVARVLASDPEPMARVRSTVPPHVEAAVRSALAKLPADRPADARAFAEALSRESGLGNRESRLTNSRFPSSDSRRVRWLPWSVAAVLAAAAGAGWWRAEQRPSGEAPVQVSVELPPDVDTDGEQIPLAISPDGRTAVVAAADATGRRLLYRRRLGTAGAEVLPGTDGAYNPAISPDGRSVAFTADGQLRTVPLDGGPVRTLADVGATSGTSWSPSGRIVVSISGRLATVPEGGGPLRRLPDAGTPAGLAERLPVALPDGKTVLYTLWGGGMAAARIMRRSLDGGPATSLADSSLALARVPGGVVAAAGGGTLRFLPTDDAVARVTGPSRQLLDGVATWVQIAQAAVAPNGTLLYQPGSELGDIVLFDPRSRDTTVVTRERREYIEARVSPDGRHIATAVSGRDGQDVWVLDVAARTATRLTDDGERNGRAEWTSDGTRLLYRTHRNGRVGIVQRRWDGADAAVPVEQPSGIDVWEGMLSPDGRYLLYRTGTTGTADLWWRALAGDTTSHPFARTPRADQEARFSPDGKMVAWVSNVSGLRQVYVAAFPSGEGRTQVSDAESEQPVWSPDGRALHYVTNRARSIVRATLKRDAGGVSVIARDTVVRGGFSLYALSGHATYDVMRDGRLVLVRGDAVRRLPVAVTHWLATAQGGSAR